MNESPLSAYFKDKNWTLNEYRINLRKMLQKICLLGLWRSSFFEHAAFYGGTALQMLYGLDRFSEDLDFSLLTPNPDFKLDRFIKSIQSELEAWSIKANTEIHEKTHSNIESAFIKANTRIVLVELEIPDAKLGRIHRNEISKVKIEVDPDPPCPFESEAKFILEPIPFSVRTMKLCDLYAGKMHAVLARSWRNRVKGRDWYDLIWYIKSNAELNLEHLEFRLKQSGHLNQDTFLTKKLFRELIIKRINEVNFTNAKNDVFPFIQHPDSLNIWSEDFFLEISKQIRFYKH